MVFGTLTAYTKGMDPTKPTEMDILGDMARWIDRGSDPEFQIARAKRRWLACGYPILGFDAAIPMMLRPWDMERNHETH